MIESHLNNQNNPYLYNGKELDAETGFYYYGARYYDPKGSLWLSVDPLAEKMPDFSAYAYAFNNPVMFVDPTGMENEGWITQMVDGKKKISYESAVNTVDEAKAAGYEGVTAVSVALTVSMEGEYSFSLNANGSVTNSEGNTLFSDSLMSFTTGAGTNISSIGLMKPFEYNRFMASGAINEDNSIANIFIIGAALKPIIGGLFGSSASTTGRVFWSGGEVAKGAAAEFAVANGMKTLEMTTIGSIMNTISPFLYRSISNPIWKNLSTNFAKGAVGEVNFFTTTAGPRATSIWLTVERPILQSNGVKIITNTIK